MTFDQTIQALDAQVEQGKKLVEASASLERLKSNRDFKKLILEGYFKDDAIRLTSLLGHPAYQDPAKRQVIYGDLHAIAGLQEYFRTVLIQGEQGQKQIESAEDMRTHMESVDSDESEVN